MVFVLDPAEYHVFYMDPSSVLSLILFFQLGGKGWVYFHFDGERLLVYPNLERSRDFSGLSPWERDALKWLNEKGTIEVSEDSLMVLGELALDVVDEILESLRAKDVVRKSDLRSELRTKLFFFGFFLSLIIVSGVIAFLREYGGLSLSVSFILVLVAGIVFPGVLMGYLLSGEQESPEAKRLTQEFGAYTEEFINMIVRELPRKTSEVEIVEILDKAISRGLPYVMAINERFAFELVIKAYKIIAKKQDERLYVSGWLPTWLDPDKTKQYLGGDLTLKRVLKHLVDIVNEISEALGEGNLTKTLSTELIDSIYEE